MMKVNDMTPFLGQNRNEVFIWSKFTFCKICAIIILD